MLLACLCSRARAWRFRPAAHATAGGELYRLHRRDLDPVEVTEHDGIPVTTTSRTIRDCLTDGTDPYQLRLAVDEAESQGLLRRAEAEGLRGLIDARSVAGTRRRA